MHYLYLITLKIWSQCRNRAADNEVLFGKDLEIRTKMGTILQFEEQDIIFFWKTVNSIGSENCNLASGDRLSLWHKRLGHNNIEDLLKLKDHAIGPKVSEHDLGNCDTCQLNKSRKLPVPKDSWTTAKDVLEIDHTDILGPINPEAVDGHRYAIGFVDSFSRHQKVYFLKTRDDAIDKVTQFFADIGKPGTLVCDDAGEFNSNEIKQLCVKQGVRQELSASYAP